MSDDTSPQRQPEPLFDPTINYGHILTALSFIVAATGAFFGVNAELQNVDKRVANIEAARCSNLRMSWCRPDDRTSGSMQSNAEWIVLSKSSPGRQPRFKCLLFYSINMRLMRSALVWLEVIGPVPLDCRCAARRASI